jgi:ABC-type uncharacterized transport system substrate-binding protein
VGCSQEQQQEAIIYVHGVWTAKDRTDEVVKRMFENVPEVVAQATLFAEVSSSAAEIKTKEISIEIDLS